MRIGIRFLLACGMALAPFAWAHPPWGVDVDGRGQVYFSDLETVWKIDPQARLVQVRAGVAGRHTHDLHLGPSGELYGEDLVYEPGTQRFVSSLWRIDAQGRQHVLIAGTDDPPEGASPLRDASGASYHVNWTRKDGVLVFRRDGRGRSEQVHGNRRAGAAFRQGVMEAKQAFGPDGALYFIAGAGVGKWSPKTGVTMLAADLRLEPGRGQPKGTDTTTQLFGIDVDAKGDAYVADWGNRRVIRIGEGGQVSTVHRSAAPWQPTGVAERDGVVYILEHLYTSQYRYAGSRVVRRTRDGSARVLATRVAGSP